MSTVTPLLSAVRAALQQTSASTPSSRTSPKISSLSTRLSWDIVHDKVRS